MSSYSSGSRSNAVRDLVSLSREYGSNIDFVVAAGGNTSVKIGHELWVKASGAILATADESTFVALERSALDDVLSASYPDDAEEREVLVKRGLLRAMLRPDLDGRPSVEASLHNLISYQFVVHTHPWKVNGLTCSKRGMSVLRERFGGRAIVLPYCDAGYTLAVRLQREMRRFVGSAGHEPQLIFLGNHGLFVGADSAKEIRLLTAEVIALCENEISPLPRAPTTGNRKSSGADSVPASRPLTAERRIAELLNVIRSSLSTEVRKTTALLQNTLTATLFSSSEGFKAVSLPFIPDQIVYCLSHPLVVRATGAKVSRSAGSDSVISRPIIKNYLRALSTYRTKHHVDPYVICVEGVGLITVGNSEGNAAIIANVFHDAMKIAFASATNGGPLPMTLHARRFIESWEVEKYRRSVSTGAGASGGSRTASTSGGRTAIVTGGARGFGEGMVRALHAIGYNVVIADLSVGRGTAIAAELGKLGRPNGVTFEMTDVSDEESVCNLVALTLISFGGCDLFISNAGVVRAGGLDDIDSDSFDSMTSVNYKGYFNCAKHASVAMKRQHEHAPHLHSDIVQINSKTGLVGSNKNFAYAGGKFGGIGLTQSFALELMPHKIKVNSICPGNFLDGPLWSDPEKGLFKQYLKAGKVPGAKSTDDVRRAYEEKVPVGRGCTVQDVMRAIVYVVDQEYETGQAVPVTGGQVMLK